MSTDKNMTNEPEQEPRKNYKPSPELRPEPENKLTPSPKYDPYYPPTFEDENEYYGGGRGGGRVPQAPKSGFMGDGAKTLIIVAIVSLIVTFVVTTFFTPFASKKSYESDITRIEMDLVAMRETDQGFDTEIDAIADAVNSQTDRVTMTMNDFTSELDQKITEFEESFASYTGNYASPTDVTDGVNNANSYTDSKYVALSDQINSLESQLSILAGVVGGLEAQIEELITEEDTTTTNGEVEAKTRSASDIIIPLGSTTTSGMLKLTIENNTAVDIEDAVITLIFNASPAYSVSGLNLVTANTSLTGGANWYLSPSSSAATIVFTNGFGLDIEAGNKVDLMLNLNLELDANTAQIVYYTPEIFTFSYD